MKLNLPKDLADCVVGDVMVKRGFDQVLRDRPGYSWLGHHTAAWYDKLARRHIADAPLMGDRVQAGVYLAALHLGLAGKE